MVAENTRFKQQNVILVVLILLGSYLLFQVFASFIIPCSWAAVLTIAFYPYYIWILGRTGMNRSLAAVIACATIGLFVVVPMVFLGAAIAEEVSGLYQWAEGYVKVVSSQGAEKTVILLPAHITEFLRRNTGLSNIQLNDVVAALIKETSSWLVGGMTDIIKNFGQMVFNAILILIAMFYLFRDGWKLLAIGMRFVPLPSHDREKLVERTGNVIKATLIGGLFVGLVQGVMGGAAFWVVGLNAPILWGFVMFLLSFLPWLGTALVWMPAAIYLLLIGDYYSGVGLLLWGVLVVGLIDNLLRPMLISDAAELNSLLVFFSIIGAANAFGIIGLIAGPLILSIAAAGIEIYQENNQI